jgi:hypothetical protein
VGVATFGSSVGGRGFSNAGFSSLPTVAPPPSSHTPVGNIAANLVNPMIQTWSFGFQRQLPANMILDVAYVGTRGEHLFLNEELNPGVNFHRINPNFSSVFLRTNSGDSNYHGLQTRLERGFKNGLTARMAYTFSKAIDDVNSEVFVTTNPGSTRQSDPFNRRADRSIAAFDAPHRFVWSFVWDIPGPREGWLSQVAGFWSLSGIYQLQSGSVATPYVGGVDLNGDLSGFNDRPAISNPLAPATSVAVLASIFGLTSPTGYVDANGNPIALNNARYVVDPALRANIAGRNSLRAPWLNRFDVNLTKAFRIMEGHKLEMRFEFFNVFNHPYYTWANAGIGSDQGDSNVLNSFFNQPRVNDGGNSPFLGSNRALRLKLRYSF